MGDARFVGNAPWRQHEQTFDALLVSNTSLPATTLSYAYVDRVNRMFGPDSPIGVYDSHSHLFNAVYNGFLPALKLESYAYLLLGRVLQRQSRHDEANGPLRLAAAMSGDDAFGVHAG